MRIVIYPHSMEQGGSQGSAIDIAAALQRRGHDVLVFGPPGRLVDTLTARGVRFEPAPLARIRPSFAVMRRLTRLVSAFRADIVHAFEWPPAVEAAFGPLAFRSVPVVSTVMSMAVAPFIPPSLPVTVGTRSILAAERHRGPNVSLLVPPVDTERDRARDPLRSKEQLGIEPNTIVVSMVCRLVPELKLEGVHAAIRAVGELAAEFPIRLVIAGDGPARDELEAAAARVNAVAGTTAVQLTGNLADPSDLYDAADIALGMGGSALRSMAFGKPLIVQGERGFWRLLEPTSASQFERDGWFGIGNGGDGAVTLERALRELLANPEHRADLGEFSRELAHSTYGLEAATDRVLELYRSAIEGEQTRPSRKLTLVPAYLSVLGYDFARKVRRRLGGVPSDDFNTISRMQPTLRGSRAS